MNTNICKLCILKDTCKLYDSIRSTCPIFKDRPPQAGDYEDHIDKDAKEGCEQGGGG